MNSHLKEQFINNFVELVKIDSISKEERKIKDYLVKRLSKHGISLQEDTFGNLYKTGNQGQVMLTAHLDTVEPGRNIKPMADSNIIKSDGTTILGADNKAGVAIILTLLETLPKESLGKVEVVFTIQEEIGMVGAYNFDTKLLKSKYGISFDKSQYDFGTCMVLGCNYSDDFEIIIKGEISHASRPQPQLNPLLPFIELFSKFKPGFIGDKETMNIGIVDGFIQPNSSPGELRIKGDIRTTSKLTADNYFSSLEEFTKTLDTKCQFEFNRTRITDGYSIDSNEVFVKEVLSALKLFGIQNTELIHRGSTTDAAAFSQNGIPTLLLSCGVYDTHKTTEFLNINEGVKAVEFCNKYILALD